MKIPAPIGVDEGLVRSDAVPSFLYCSAISQLRQAVNLNWLLSYVTARTYVQELATRVPDLQQQALEKFR